MKASQPPKKPYYTQLYPKHLLIGGAIIGFTLYGARSCQADNRDSIQEALETPRVTVETVKSVNVGDQVILEGEIAIKSPTVIEDLVVACEQEYYNDGEEYYWEPLKRHPNPLILNIAPELSSQVNITEPCNVEGYRRRYLEMRENAPTFVSKRRAIGYVTGQQITVIGTVVSANPLSLKATYARGGSYADYLKSLKSSKMLTKLLAGFLLFLGTVIALIPKLDNEEEAESQAIENPWD